MSIKKEFTFASRDGVTQIKAFSWAPEDGNIKAVLQIVHGMIEYMGRYDDYANYMTTQGFLVVGEDHLGHGHSAATEKDLGYFAPKDSDTILIRDVHRLKKIIQEQYPGVPYYILGHSMGSFMLRKYLTWYGTGIDGAIISGTGVMPKAATETGIFLTKFLRLLYGDRHKSKLITMIAFGTYTKKIPNSKTASDWLSTDDTVVSKYRHDPFCTYGFTLNAYRGLFKLIRYVCNPRYLSTIPLDLPIFMVSGLEDPVGAYGKGPSKVYSQYKKAGIEDIQLTLYPDFRHEVLNEIGKEQCYEDILTWLNSHIDKNIH